MILAGEVAERARRSCSDLPIVLLLLSDGRANVAVPGTTDDPWQQALLAAAQLAAAKVLALVLDTDSSFVRLGRVQELARALGAQCLTAEELSSETLLLKVRQNLASGAIS